MFLQTKYIFLACRYELKFQGKRWDSWYISRLQSRWKMGNDCALESCMLASKIFVESKKQKKVKEMIKKSIIYSEERVLKMIAAIKEYKNLLAFSSTRKSKLEYCFRKCFRLGRSQWHIRGKGNREWASWCFPQWAIFWRKYIILRFSKENKFENVCK